MVKTGLGSTIFNPTSFSTADACGGPVSDSLFETRIHIPDSQNPVAGIFVLNVAWLTGKTIDGADCRMPLFAAVGVNAEHKNRLLRNGNVERPTMMQAQEDANSMNTKTQMQIRQIHDVRQWQRSEIDLSPLVSAFPDKPLSL